MRSACTDVICRLARLMETVLTMTEFEINPLRVHQRGVVALGVRGTIGMKMANGKWEMADGGDEALDPGSVARNRGGNYRFE
ncbi:MAG TPA: hypothetical protein VMO47_13755 [Rhodothermales bacterium]|nr:hypothetical protein [Rhodothermales bacterium]